jgi:anti-anti-sigma factor
VEEDGFRVDRFDVAGIVVLVADGDVDVATADALKSSLDEIGSGQHVVVDCSGVAFMDSTGLDVLLNQSRRLRVSGGWLHVRHASPSVLRIVEVTGLGELIEPEAPKASQASSWIPPDST